MAPFLPTLISSSRFMNETDTEGSFDNAANKFLPKCMILWALIMCAWIGLTVGVLGKSFTIREFYSKIDRMYGDYKRGEREEAWEWCFYGMDISPTGWGAEVVKETDLDTLRLASLFRQFRTYSANVRADALLKGIEQEKTSDDFLQDWLAIGPGKREEMYQNFCTTLDTGLRNRHLFYEFVKSRVEGGMSASDLSLAPSNDKCIMIGK